MESFIGSRTGGLRGELGSTPDAPITSPTGPVGRAQRVLVVDDNAHSVESLALIINLWGHDARVAYNGAEAIETARQYQPDVVLLDIGLPGMDGYAVARVLRDDPRVRHATLLAMTGYGRDEDRRDAIAAGFDRHLLKPLELDDLEALLAELASTPR
jgi:CheY-like chemotaxis protein